MLAAPFKVVLDANVLFPFSLRDTLLRAAADEFFQLYWSERILDEVQRNLVATSTVTDEQAMKLRHAMTNAFPEAMVTGYEPLIDGMPNHEKDRHVTAAAVKVGARLIVTNNLKDFRLLPEGTEVQSPDEFLCNLFELAPERMVAVVKRQATALRRPPVPFEELLRGLAKLTPDFAQSVTLYASVGPL